MKKQNGFSLIELLIVVAIILIIAAIAIPNLLRSRMAANEASAVGSMRSINTGEVTYASSYPDTGYAVDLISLGGTSAQCVAGTSGTPAVACLLDPVLSAGQKSGYIFTAAGAKLGASITNNVFVTTGVPLGIGSTGQRGFGSDQSGVIHYTLSGAAATVADSALQ